LCEKIEAKEATLLTMPLVLLSLHTSQEVMAKSKKTKQKSLHKKDEYWLLYIEATHNNTIYETCCV
jgi:hypothetical protein